MIERRYKNIEDCKKTFKRYIEGAKEGTIGHFSMYPLNIEEMTLDYKRIINSRMVQGNYLNGIYIHWPFCFLKGEKIKCDFCMCNTKNTDYDKKILYYSSLLKEINMYAEMFSEPAKMLYIGGGTPLSMSIKELEMLFSALYSQCLINKDTFISVETRPDTLTKEKLMILEKYKVNRLSVGVESLDDNVIELMGRGTKGIAYREVVKDTLELIENSSIEYVNVDLLYSYPDEDMNGVIDSICVLLKYKPDSFSIYQLGMPYKLTEIESKVISGKELKTLEYRKLCLEKIKKVMKSNGYLSVADSIWSKEDIKSYDNLDGGKGYANFYNQTNTTAYGIWIGLGVGAGGYIEGVGPVLNVNDITSYINKVEAGELGIEKGEILNENELMRAEIILSFLHRHLDIEKFTEMHGKKPDEVFEYEFKVLREYNMLNETSSYIEIKEEDIYLLQGIVRLFFSSNSEVAYRKKEVKRIDYQKYRVDYRQLP